MRRPLPAEYVALDVGQAHLVAHQHVANSLVTLLGQYPTLYEWAAAHPARRTLQGRRPVYAVPLPNGDSRVVVRRSAHGGVLAPLLGDLFLAPTRAPLELDTALLLARVGVPTPPVVGFACYIVGPMVRRVDVLTAELPGLDLGSALREAKSPAERSALVAPVAALLGAMGRAGAWHPDLNVKNILLVPDESGELHPAVLDVDRVSFVPPGDPNVRDANYERLRRSVEKWRNVHGVGFTVDELQDMRQIVLADEAVQAVHRTLAMQEFMP